MLAKAFLLGQFFTVQTSWTVHARGEAIHWCPLVTVPITTEDLAPWRATWGSVNLCQGQGCFWTKCQLPNISPHLFVLLWLLANVPFHSFTAGIEAGLHYRNQNFWYGSLHSGKRKWKWKSLNHVRLFCNPMDCSPWNSPGQNTGVGNLSLQIFPFQGSNPGLPHCRQILYQLSHQGSPRILEWIPYSFFNGSSQPMNWTGVSCIAGRFFTNWAIWAAPSCLSSGKRKTNTNGKALQW